MNEQPILATQHLYLRPLRLDDASSLQNLAGAKEIADTTISIPHPYKLEDAEQYIAQYQEDFKQEAVRFGIETQARRQLIGAIELRDIDREHLQAELSFWIGVPWWGRGFASEAAQGILSYGFEQIHLNRIYAHHMVRNPSSGRVMEKIGMQKEGLMRQRVRKWEKFEDVVLWAIVYQDWLAASA